LFNDFPQQPSRVPINAKRYQIHPTPTRQKRLFRRTYTQLLPECPLFKQRNSCSNWSFFRGFPLTLQTNDMIVRRSQGSRNRRLPYSCQFSIQWSFYHSTLSTGEWRNVSLNL
jgi:hypothetical protein